MCVCVFMMSSLGHQRLLRQLFLQLLWSELPGNPDQDHLANPWGLLLLSTNFLIPMSFAVGTPIYNSLFNIFFLKRPLDTPNISQATSTTTHESQIVLDVIVTHIEILDFGLRFLIFFLQHRIAGIHSKDIQYVTEVLKSSACFQPARQIYYYITIQQVSGNISP